MKSKEQDVKRASIVTSIVLKTDTADSNGRVYSKGALENAVNEYNVKYDSIKLEIRHDGTVEFITAANEVFENGVNKETFNEIYKHDYVNSSRMINPYFIGTQKMLKSVNGIKKG